MFAGIAMCFTAVTPSIDTLNYPSFLFITPMSLFSGTFFPLTLLPVLLQYVALTFPPPHPRCCHHADAHYPGPFVDNLPEYRLDCRGIACILHNLDQPDETTANRLKKSGHRDVLCLRFFSLNEAGLPD